MNTFDKKNVLISGMAGVGKSALVGRLLERFPDEARGFVTEARTDTRGTPTGFVLRVLAGQSFTVARPLVQGGSSDADRWCVQPSVVDKMGVRAVLDALVDADLVVIDEIAPMQLVADRFRRVVELALDSRVPVLATMHTAGHPFTEAIRSREDVRIYEIGQHNRDEVIEPIALHLRRLIDDVRTSRV